MAGTSQNPWAYRSDLHHEHTLDLDMLELELLAIRQSHFSIDDELSSALKASYADLFVQVIAGKTKEYDLMHLPDALSDSCGIGVHGEGELLWVTERRLVHPAINASNAHCG